jgi:hypothetical protein
LAAVPPDQREAFVAALNQKEAPELDRMLEEGMNKSPTSKWAGEHSKFVMGEPTPHATFAKILKFNLRDGIAEKIACPTLVLDAEDDMFFKGQPQELYDHLTCPKTLIHFTVEEGAGAHCQVGAHRLAFGRIYDWLDDTLGHVS